MANLALKRQRKFERRMARKAEEAKYYTEKEVLDILSIKDWNCVFELGAPKIILSKLSHHTKGEWMTAEHIDEFRKCFLDSMLYWPQLGIDRIGVKE